MATIITKELAEKIAVKLHAQKTKTGAHDWYTVSFNGQIVASFGIRHGSRKDSGHDHLPDAIHFGPSKARRLGQCSISEKQWLESLRERNLLPTEEPEPDEGEGKATDPNQPTT